MLFHFQVIFAFLSFSFLRPDIHVSKCFLSFFLRHLLDKEFSKDDTIFRIYNIVFYAGEAALLEYMIYGLDQDILDPGFML